mgnify:CR=1 FL=1
MRQSLKCYTSGRHLADGGNVGTVSFAVPDYGLLFRCRGEGTRAELEIIALMSFLRFAEANKELFAKRDLQIYTDFPFIVFLLNGKIRLDGRLTVVATQIQQYSRELSFQVKWIDGQSNRAASSVGDIPVLPADAGITIKGSAALSLSEKNHLHPSDRKR